MSIEVHEAVYRNALRTAFAEVDEIGKRVEQLRIRKEALEKASNALKSIIEAVGQAEGTEYQSRSAQGSPTPDGASMEPVSNSGKALRDESDALQRSINQALGRIAVA